MLDRKTFCSLCASALLTCLPCAAQPAPPARPQAPAPPAAVTPPQPPAVPAAPNAPQAPAPPRPPASIASHPDWPKARAADVGSADAILAALYDVISGPAGQTRDRERFLSLFVPDARLMPVRHAQSGNGADLLVLSPQQFYAIAEPSFEKGFFERGIHNVTEGFGDMVHIFSTYESRRAKDDAKPFARGINSIQLLKDGDRYWVVTILWDEEKPGGPVLPDKYLSQ